MEAPTDADAAHLLIDEGFRRWYESCPCCLSESYPEVKSALDREAEKTTSADMPDAR